MPIPRDVYKRQAQEDFEDEYFNSRLRIEKLDSETGDSIIHDGALFKIYAAKREVEKEGMGTVTGSGNCLLYTSRLYCQPPRREEARGQLYTGQALLGERQWLSLIHI